MSPGLSTQQPQGAQSTDQTISLYHVVRRYVGKHVPIALLITILVMGYFSILSVLLLFLITVAYASQVGLTALFLVAAAAGVSIPIVIALCSRSISIVRIARKKAESN
jgi:uncharacterized membrane protein